MTNQEIKDLAINNLIAIKELGKRMEETDRQFKEIARQSKETDKRLDKLIKAQEKTDEEFRKTDEEFRKTDEKFRKTDEKFRKTDEKFKQLRRLGINIGFSVEEFFYESFNENRVMGKIHFDNIGRHVKGEKYKFELDIVLYNNDSIGIIEAKHRLRANAISDFLGKISKFKEEFHQYKNFKIYAGLAAYSFQEKSDELAQKKGLYVFSRYGRKVLIKNSDDFEAKIF